MKCTKCPGTLRFNCAAATYENVVSYTCDGCKLSTFILLPAWPVTGTSWVNKKNGERYVVIGSCEHTETGEPLVIYQGIKMHARPLAMWADKFAKC